jgi:hypothetical protein
MKAVVDEVIKEKPASAGSDLASRQESRRGLAGPEGPGAGSAIRPAPPAIAEVFIPSCDEVATDPTPKEIFQGEIFFLPHADGVPPEPPSSVEPKRVFGGRVSTFDAIEVPSSVGSDAVEASDYVGLDERMPLNPEGNPDSLAATDVVGRLRPGGRA